MQLALQDASMVDKLCVLDIAPVRYEGGLEVIFETMIATDASAFESREAVDAHIAQRILEPGVRAFLLTNLERNEQRKLQWRINFAELYSHYQDFLSAPAMGQPFEGETLFIKGENSDYILPAHREAVLCSFPKAELKQVAGTGHWLHAEKPEIVHGLIKRFVCRD
jgi:esterase